MVKCADGSRERVAVGVCALSDKAKAPDCSGGAGGTAAAKPECAPDVCPEGKYGRLTGLYYGPGTYHYCEYFCEADADCPTGSACACGADGVGLCAEAECSSTAACAAGATCRTIGSPNCGPSRVHLKCIDGADACVRNQDCAGGKQCQSGSSGDSFCLGSGGCGRPILVEHVARVASLLSSTAWS